MKIADGRLTTRLKLSFMTERGAARHASISGTTRIEDLAVQRNEAQYHDETLPSYRTQVEPQMVKTGMVVPTYYTDLVAPSGEVLVSRDVPELQPFTYYYKEIFGKLPSGIKYEALKAANMSSTNMTRMVLMPPKVPAECVAILRKAFD